jgi:hypothetical protein
MPSFLPLFGGFSMTQRRIPPDHARFHARVTLDAPLRSRSPFQTGRSQSFRGEPVMFDYLYQQVPGPHFDRGGIAPRRAEIARRLYLEKVSARQEAERRANGFAAARLARRIAALARMALSQITLLRLTGTARPVQRWMR